MTACRHPIASLTIAVDRDIGTVWSDGRTGLPPGVPLGHYVAGQRFTLKCEGCGMAEQVSDFVFEAFAEAHRLVYQLGEDLLLVKAGKSS
jgi:hypothetical protein